MPFLPLLIDTAENKRWHASSKEYAQQLAEEDAKAEGGRVFFKPAHTTASMLGEVPRQAYYATIPKKQYEKGVPIVVTNPKKDKGYILHNVTDTRPDGSVHTKGSFNSRGDGWSPAEEIIGQVKRYFSW